MSTPSCGCHIHLWFKGHAQSADVAGRHGVHLGPRRMPVIALVAPAPKNVRASPLGIVFNHRLYRFGVDRDRAQHCHGFLVDCGWKCTARNRFRNDVQPELRSFEGKRISIVLTLGGTVIWLVACCIPQIYIQPVPRVTVMVVIAVSYTLLAAFELWRGRGDEVWRWPIMALLVGHATAITVRIPLAMTAARPDLFDVDLRTFVIFEIMFVSICGAYLLGGLVKDQIAGLYKQASLVDPLTGITNRRGFFQSGERLMIRSRLAHMAIAVILFDIDHFKRINDLFGHSAGDHVLAAFCRLAGALLRPTDLFGRLGGDEFACLLPDVTRQDALALAERLRRAFEAASHTVGGRTFSATVSTGICELGRCQFRSQHAVKFWPIRHYIAPKRLVTMVRCSRRNQLHLSLKKRQSALSVAG